MRYLLLLFLSFSVIAQNQSSLSFDGGDIATSATPAFRSGDSTGTFGMWIKPTLDASQDFVVTFSDIGSAVKYIGFVVSGDSGFSVQARTLAGTDAITTVDKLTDQVWQSVVVRCEDTTWSVFINGVESDLTVGAGTNSGRWFKDAGYATDIDTMTIGCLNRSSGESVFYTGIVDDIVYIDTTLTDAQILEYWGTNAPRNYAEIMQGSTDSLRMWFRFEEATGTTTNSHMPTAFSATLLGGTTTPTWSGDDPGFYVAPRTANNYSLYFRSDGEHVGVDTTSWRGSDEFGYISYWVKFEENLTDFAYHFTTSQGDGAVQYLGAVHGLNQDMVYTQRDNDTADTIVEEAGSFTTGPWYHVAVGIEESGATDTTVIYINGAKRALTVSSGANNGDWLADVALRSRVAVGGLYRTDFEADFELNGWMDEVIYGNRKITQTLVDSLYNNGTPQDMSDHESIVDYWDFEEGTGTTTTGIMGFITFTFGLGETAATQPAWDSSNTPGWTIVQSETRKPNLNKLNSLKGLKP